jgi:S1-C subfamily serine protease
LKYAVTVLLVQQVVVHAGEDAHPLLARPEAVEETALGAAADDPDTVVFDDEVTLEEQRQFGLPQTQGTYVVDVLPGSPAAQAGLVAADPQTGRGGDLIVAIDGRPVNDFGDLNSYLVFNTTVGQTVTLTVLRDGEEVELSLTLARRPAN